MRKGQKRDAARNLRQAQTTPEQVMWSQLRGSRLNGRKFERQCPVGPFVVDFCCIELNLIVELDGDVHAFQTGRDISRQLCLEKQGYRVVRFTNHDVFDNLSGVLQTLWDLTKVEASLPSP